MLVDVLEVELKVLEDVLPEASVELLDAVVDEAVDGAPPEVAEPPQEYTENNSADKQTNKIK